MLPWRAYVVLYAVPCGSAFWGLRRNICRVYTAYAWLALNYAPGRPLVVLFAANAIFNRSSIYLLWHGATVVCRHVVLSHILHGKGLFEPEGCFYSLPSLYLPCVVPILLFWVEWIKKVLFVALFDFVFSNNNKWQIVLSVTGIICYYHSSSCVLVLDHGGRRKRRTWGSAIRSLAVLLPSTTWRVAHRTARLLPEQKSE